jgi:penicillin-binding protein 1A
MTDLDARPRRIPGPDGPRRARTGSGTRRGLSRRPRWRRATRTALRVAAVLLVGVPLLVLGAAAAGGGLLLFGNLPGTVPEENPLVRSEPSFVYDATGQEIGSFREFDLTVPVTKDDVPQVLKDAVIAAEDRSFWTHRGVDPQGLVRAAVANYQEGEVVQGGSTITQQYVKTAYLTTERTIERKLNEAVLATRLERELTDELGSVRAAKEEILWRYLDSSYFGGGAYGAGAAAETYFRKSLRDLNASEAATLAGIIPAPSLYGPRDNVTLAEARRREVLAEMLEVGSLTQADYDQAIAQPLFLATFGVPEPGTATLVFPPPESGASRYPFFVDYVRQYLTERYGSEQVFRGGLRIETTIDPRLQELAEQQVAEALEGTAPPLEMSLVSVEPSTGYVKALVGGRDFAASQVNLALGGSTGMQPGSAFKGFTAAAAIEQGYGPDTTYNTTGAWTVPNCTGQCTVKGGSAGPIDMRAAMAASSNTYFAQLIYDVGPDRVAEMANRLGVTRITTDRSYGVSLTLGAYEVSPLDMAAGYSVIANHGVRVQTTPVVKVTTPDGAVLEDNTDPEGTQVLDPAIADTVTDMLKGVIAGGTGRRAEIGRTAAGKTGTAENYTAAWFVGYVPQLTTAVWMGYADEPKPLRRIGGFGEVQGGTIPARTWAEFMRPAVGDYPVVDFPVPGPLPPPRDDGGVGVVSSRAPGGRRTAPQLAQDCGGPCVRTPTLPAPAPPPTTAPPPPSPVAPDPDATSTSTTAPSSSTSTTEPQDGP